MTRVIDADTHIAESESMWELIDESMRHRRPVMLTVPGDTLSRDLNVLWLIDGRTFPKASGKGGFRLITPAASMRETGRTDILRASREITDVEIRLADMDAAGVAVQVIYAPPFLVQVSDDPALEVALCGAYNRYLARVYNQANGRLRWVAALPLQTLDRRFVQCTRPSRAARSGCFSAASPVR